ncbi:MAG: DUF928 domain-containing protein [Leptolyngbyaceae cyanobacterium SM2_5_2]|nr:DUF928 domain-containing protein [Leptolyngbyaceae cyanobacterium SM2_5_2]
MKQFSGMRKLPLTITGLATGSLIYLLLASHQPSWGHVAPDSLGHDPGQRLAQASRRRNYVPPARSTAPRRATSLGTRGGLCESSSTANQEPILPSARFSVMTVAPQTHIGQTASTRPTLTWYIAEDNPYPVELQLYRYTSSDPTDSQLERVEFFDVGLSQPGWMTFTLPTSLPPLNVGETYRWKVIVKCSESQPSRNKIDEADLQVVPSPPGMGTTGEPVQQAEQYGAAGLWYDAIAALSHTPVSPAAAACRNELVGDLAELAAQEAKDPNDVFSLLSDRLRYIANSD